MQSITFDNDIYIFNSLKDMVTAQIILKCYGSRMHNAHTMSPADMLATMQKLYGQ